MMVVVGSRRRAEFGVASFGALDAGKSLPRQVENEGDQRQKPGSTYSGAVSMTVGGRELFFVFFFFVLFEC